MYPVIKEAMEKKHMTLVDLASATGIRYQTLSEKLRGNYQVTVTEAVAIKKALGVKTPLEVLFEKKEASV
jgi:transcriptional regulator with XRE-family HTH domain